MNNEASFHLSLLAVHCSLLIVLICVICGELKPNNSLNQTFALIRMTCLVPQDAFTTCVGIAIYAKMPARIIHPYVLTHHTPAYLPLAFIFQILSFYGYGRNLAEQIRFGQSACTQVIHQFLVFAPQPFHQLPVYATVMFNAVTLQVDFLGTRGKRQVPPSGFPYITQLHQTFHHFQPLLLIQLCGFHILFGKAMRFLYQIALHFPIGFYIHKAEHQLIGISFQ